MAFARYIAYALPFMVVLVTLVLPFVADAQSGTTTSQWRFVPLTGIPGVPENPEGIEDYANALYILAIAVAAALGVLRIIMAGVKYMFSETVPAKGDAKKEIGWSLFGLVLILGAVTILNEINPNLRNFDFLSKAPPIEVEGFQSRTSGQIGSDQVVEGDGRQAAANCAANGGKAYTLPVIGYLGGSTGRTRVICEAKPVETVSESASLMDAQERANACGGRHELVAQGKYKVFCPGGSTQQPTNTSSQQQVTGWPKTFTSFAEYNESLAACRAAGGTPEGKETGLNQYSLSCKQ